MFVELFRLRQKKLCFTVYKGYDYLTENLSKLLIHILSKGSGRDLETGFRKDYLH